MPRHRSVVYCLAVSLCTASLASGVQIGAQDREGRPIHFETSAGTDVEPSAEIIRQTAHGKEVSTVTIHLTSEADVQRVCGRGTAGCYQRRGQAASIFAPTRGRDAIHTLVHEYGHHLAASLGGVNGAALAPWRAARGIDQLKADGKVADGYSFGWGHSIGEIFAEDFAQSNRPSDWRITWIGAPNDAVRAALSASIGGRAPEGQPAAPVVSTPDRPSETVSLHRRGGLTAGSQDGIPFGLRGPGRTVTASGTLTGVGGPASARVDLVCNRRRIASATGSENAPITLAATSQGPGRCVAVMTGLTGTATFDLQLRLSTPR